MEPVYVCVRVSDVEYLDKGHWDLGFYHEHHLGARSRRMLSIRTLTRTHLHPPKGALHLHWAICLFLNQRIAWGPVISHWTKAKRLWLAFYGDWGAICLCIIRTILR